LPEKMELSKKGETIINGEGLVAGRLASIIAKRLLMGEKIVVVNAEKIIITGTRKRVLQWYGKRVLEWRTYHNPEKRGPKIPRRPDLVFKRMVRGMLPKKKPRGREALKRLRVYIGVPEELQGKEAEAPEAAKLKNKQIPYVTLAEIYESFGGRL